MKWEMFCAVIYGGVCGALIAVAVWNFLTGYHSGAALFVATALPLALFAGLRLNNWRLIRTMIAKQPAPKKPEDKR